MNRPVNVLIILDRRQDLFKMKVGRGHEGHIKI